MAISGVFVGQGEKMRVLKMLLIKGGAIALGICMVNVLATPGIAQENREPRRPRPAFFEESRRSDRAGFSDTFLGDALNGSADPLGGRGSVGTGSDRTTVSDAVSQPRGRSAAPAMAIDRTRVIIPNANAVRSSSPR